MMELGIMADNMSDEILIIGDDNYATLTGDFYL